VTLAFALGWELRLLLRCELKHDSRVHVRESHELVAPLADARLVRAQDDDGLADGARGSDANESLACRTYE
jgi:hypothetical protein